MVRENRIKNYKFSETINATTTGSFVSQAPINGEILDVSWSFNRAGSAWINDASTGEEVWRRNAPSGAGVQVTRPHAYTNNTIGGVSIGSPVTNYVLSDNLVFNVAAAASGTQTFDINVRYR